MSDDRWQTVPHGAMPDQRSLLDQVRDLWLFARAQKMYDAQDWLATRWTGQPLPYIPRDDER